MTEKVIYNNFSCVMTDGTVKYYSYPRIYIKKDKQPKLTDKQKEEIKSHYKLGVSKSKLVRDYDISIHYLNKLLNE